MPKPSRLFALIVIALFAVPVASAADHVDAKIPVSVNPDPPVEGELFVVTFTGAATNASRVMLKVCEFNRATGHATTCLTPVEMSLDGEGNYAAKSPEAAAEILSAGGAVGVNVSVQTLTGEWIDYPGNGVEYFVFDVAENQSLGFQVRKFVPSPGAAFIAVAFALGAFLRRRS